MNLLRTKKGYDLNISGQPTEELKSLDTPDRVGMLPSKIPFIKPKLVVGVGDPVKRGTTIFFDKRNPGVRFLSPGGGRVADIRLGPRRVIEAVVIDLDAVEEEQTFDTLSDADLETMGRDELVNYLLGGGLWPLLRALPFRDIADPGDTPPAIVVALGAQEPFLAQPGVYLQGQKALLDRGLALMGRLCDQVTVYAPNSLSDGLNGDGRHATLRYQGAYPASDPGVMVYHTRSHSGENRSWFIQGQDLLSVARMTLTGRYPVERIVAVGGSESPVKCHFQTRLGAPLAQLAGAVIPAGVRPVAGGVFRGYRGDPDGYLGFYETGLTLLPEGPEEEFLGFVRPGFARPSYSRTFLSAFNRRPVSMDCNFHGEERACVACNACNRICPVDILPQLAFKCVLAGEVEDALAHGLLDCVECGLCTYACPSKIDVCGLLRSAKHAHYKEQVAP